MSMRSTCAWLGALILVACSGTEIETMPTISADAGGAGGALGTGGTGAYWYDGGIAEVPVEPEPTHQMSLSVGQGVDGHGSPFGRIRATLATFEPSELPLVRRVGDCELTDFREFDGYTRFTPTVADIQIKDGHDDPIVLEPNLMPLCMVSHDLYTYDVPAEDWPRWSEGDRLLVIAQGSHVPAFSTAPVFPGKVHVPAIVHQRSAESGLPVLYHDRDLRVFWSPVEHPVAVSIVQYHPDSVGRLAYCVLCSFPGNAGFGRITSEVLADLDTDDVLASGETRTEAYLSGMKVFRATKGDYEIVVRLTNGGGLMVDIE